MVLATLGMGLSVGKKLDHGPPSVLFWGDSLQHGQTGNSSAVDPFSFQSWANLFGGLQLGMGMAFLDYSWSDLLFVGPCLLFVSL